MYTDEESHIWYDTTTVSFSLCYSETSNFSQLEGEREGGINSPRQKNEERFSLPYFPNLEPPSFKKIPLFPAFFLLVDEIWRNKSVPSQNRIPFRLEDSPDINKILLVSLESILGGIDQTLSCFLALAKLPIWGCFFFFSSVGEVNKLVVFFESDQEFEFSWFLFQDNDFLSCKAQYPFGFFFFMLKWIRLGCLRLCWTFSDEFVIPILGFELKQWISRFKTRSKNRPIFLFLGSW